jgi:hypothetical protein
MSYGTGRGTWRIVLGILFLLGGGSSVAYPSNWYDFGGGVVGVAVGLVLIIWGNNVRKTANRVQPAWSASPQPPTNLTAPGTRAPMDQFCSSCGTASPRTAAYCSVCGKALTPSP